jgi:hypothetical protein
MGYVYIYRKKTQSIQLYETPLNVINSHIYEESHNDETSTWHCRVAIQFEYCFQLLGYV